MLLEFNNRSKEIFEKGNLIETGIPSILIRKCILTAMLKKGKCDKMAMTDND